MNRFLQYSAVPPVLLGAILALGVAFAWLAVLFTALAIFSPDSDPRAALVLLFSPLALAISVFVFVPFDSVTWESRLHQFWDFHSIASFSPIFVMTVLLALLFSARCYRRQKLYAVHHTVSWIMFIVLFGFPGLIGYLLHRRWSLLVRCPHCGQETPRDRDACLKCKTAFPPPALKAIEVFA